MMVVLQGVKSQDGLIYVRVVTKDNYEMEEPDPVETTAVVKPNRGTMEVTVTDVSPGEYAVTVLHDKNENIKMDYNFIGAPKEYWGLSRNPKVGFSRKPPDWEKVKFKVTDEDVRLEIRMRKLN